jgi:CBS domain-containing protein
MLAKDIMTTQVITITPETIMKDALRLMVELGISGLIVTDAGQNVIGVVSERDIMMAYDMLGETKGSVESFINTKVVGVNPDTPVKEVSRIMIQSNVKRVPVMEGRKCVGIISRSDVLKFILKSGAGPNGN